MSRKPYTRPMERYGWFLREPRYRRYMLRESTALIVSVYCGLALAALWTLAQGNAGEWNEFLLRQQHPGWMAWHLFSLIFFVAFQTIPWFHLAPRAMPIQLGAWKVPPAAILGMHYAGCLLCSALVLWLAGVF